MSEQPLIRNQNERDNKTRLETFKNANFTTFASPEETNRINDADDTNPSKTPMEIIPTDENNDVKPKAETQNKKNRIFTSVNNIY